MSQNFSQQPPQAMPQQQQPMPVPQGQPGQYGMNQQRMPFPGQMQGNPMQNMVTPDLAFNEQLMRALNMQPQNRPHHQQHQGPKQPKVMRPSIYVGNLPKDFYDLDLFKFFTSRGYKLCKATVQYDKITKQTLRYGFLQFYSQEEAERCQKEMNNQTVKGSQLNLSLRSNQQFDPKANVIVRNLAAEVTQQQIHDFFSKFGKIRSCKLEQYAGGKSRGFAYVQFDKADEAQKAIQESGKAELAGKKIEVLIHEKRDKRQTTDGAGKFTNLYVTGLPNGTDEKKLEGMFKEFGEISSTHIPDNAKNYGYVSFKEPADAAKAHQAMNKKKLDDGSYLLVHQHVSKRDNALAKNSLSAPIHQNMKKTFDSNLFVKNVPKATSEDELRKKFEECGPIISIRLRESHQGFFGPSAYHQYFILYEDVDSAKKAIRNFDQSQIFGGKPLQVEFWVSRQELEAERELRSQKEVEHFIKESNKDQMGGSYPGQYMNQHRGNYNQRGRGGKPRGGANQRPQQNQGYRPQQQHPGQFNQQQQRPQPAFVQQPQPPMPQPGAQQPPMPTQQPPAQPQPQFPQIQAPQVNAAEIAAIKDINQRKQVIGNAIYPCIQAVHGAVAGKITGMLLDENVVNIDRLVTDQQYLNFNANEALKLLQNAQLVPQAQQAAASQ